MKESDLKMQVGSKEMEKKSKEEESNIHEYIIFINIL